MFWEVPTGLKHTYRPRPDSYTALEEILKVKMESKDIWWPVNSLLGRTARAPSSMGRYPSTATAYCSRRRRATVFLGTLPAKKTE